MSWKWEGKSNWEGWGYPEEEESFYVPGIGRVRGRSLLDYSSADLPDDFYDDVPDFRIVDGHVVSDD